MNRFLISDAKTTMITIHNYPLRVFTVVLMFSSGVLLKSQTHTTYFSELNVLKDRFNVTFVYDSSLQLDGACRSVRSRGSLARSAQPSHSVEAEISAIAMFSE